MLTGTHRSFQNSCVIETGLSDLRKMAVAVQKPYVMRCTIWCHLHDLKNVKNTHGGVLLLVKLQPKSLELY